MASVRATVAVRPAPGQSDRHLDRAGIPGYSGRPDSGVGGIHLSRFDPDLIETAMGTDVGMVRASNQDACDEFRDASGARLLVLCDGMGGRRGGEVASRLAVDAIGRAFRASGDPARIRLEAGFTEANSQIGERAQADPHLSGMGTTALALVLDGGETAWVAHVGDSRLYRLRGEEFVALTEDHSVVGELQRHGVVSAEQAAQHPRRNELLRSIGGDRAVNVDVAELEVHPGDRYLLCCDGLWSMVRDAEIAAILEEDPPRSAVMRLVDLANDRGGTDNVTVQVVRVPAFVAVSAEETSAGHPAARGTMGGGRLRGWIDAIRRRFRRT